VNFNPEILEKKAWEIKLDRAQALVFITLSLKSGSNLMLEPLVGHSSKFVITKDKKDKILDQFIKIRLYCRQV